MKDNVINFPTPDDRLLEELRPTFLETTRLIAAAATRLVQQNQPHLLGGDEKTSRLAITAACAELAQMFAEKAIKEAAELAGSLEALQDFLNRYRLL